MSIPADDGDFKRGRFNPAIVAVGALLVAGAGAAIFFGLKSEADKPTAEQIAETRRGIYVLPRAEQIPKWEQLAKSEASIELEQEALTQLTFLQDKNVVGLAEAALKNPDHRLRGIAAQVLATVGLPDGAAAKPALLTAFKEADPSDKPQIAWALVALNEQSAWKDVLDVYRAGHLATVERVGGGRAFDVEAFAKMASPDQWATLAGDENDSVRALVADILARTGDKKYTSQLVKFMADKPDVAREAASGLGRIGDPSALNPLLDALAKANKDDRKLFLEALRDGIGGAGLVLALKGIQKDPPERAKFQTKQIFDLVKLLEDPRAANALADYLATNPTPHWMTEAALRLAEVGDLRAVPPLAQRMRLDPLKIYDDKIDPEYRRDDNERVVAARMLADLAVLHPEAADDIRAKAEDAVMFWVKDMPQPHANGLRFLVAAGSKKIVPDLRDWSQPKDPLPKEGAQPPFPRAFETAPSALRYLGWSKDETGIGILSKQLNRKDPKIDTSEDGLVGGGIAVLGMVLRGLTIGSAQGFAQAGDHRGYADMLKVMEDPKQNQQARIEVARSLAWVATDDDIKDLVKRARSTEAKDPKSQFLRGVYLETIVRKPIPGVNPTLLEMMAKDVDPAVRQQVARALAWPLLDDATEKALFEKMKDKDLMNDAALAIVLGGKPESAARAVAMFADASKEALDDLKDKYFDSFGFWSDEDLAKGRLFRWVDNAEAIAQIRVNDTLQDWARLRLGAQFNNLDFDTGPHSMTRVVLRYRLIDLAKKGDPATKVGAIATLKFMKEQGALMALKDEKSDTGPIAAKALFELMNPKIVEGEKVPEKKAADPNGGTRIVPPTK